MIAHEPPVQWRVRDFFAGHFCSERDRSLRAGSIAQSVELRTFNP
jgi:hypothetical protein